MCVPIKLEHFVGVGQQHSYLDKKQRFLCSRLLCLKHKLLSCHHLEQQVPLHHGDLYQCSIQPLSLMCREQSCHQFEGLPSQLQNQLFLTAKGCLPLGHCRRQGCHWPEVLAGSICLRTQGIGQLIGTHYFLNYPMTINCLKQI